MLLDHFHPPLAERRHPAAFLLSWTINITDWLNQQLPKRWFADPLIWEDFYQIDVREDKQQDRGGIVSRVELIGPATKSIPELQKEFISRQVGWIARGVGLLIADIVTTYSESLHAKLLPSLQPKAMTPTSEFYTASYNPVENRDYDTGIHLKADEGYYEIWHEPLTIGGSLPTMPLYLKNGPLVPVDLAETYRQALKAVRIEPDEVV